MNENQKKEIAQRLSVRVSTGIMFVELDYLPRHEKPDAAWIRNIYILLSFYTELLLKAIYVIKSNFASVDELDGALQKMGHNLEKIGQQIGTSELNRFGIKKIQRINPDYLVETDEGNFSVEDFTDIRYDFIDGKVRNLNGTEHDMFRKQIKMMHKINGLLKPLIH